MIDTAIELPTFQVPAGPVVYFLVDDGEVVHVGAAKCLVRRLADHFGKKAKGGWDFDSVQYIETTQDNLRQLERSWIRQIRPRYNKQHNHDEDEARKEIKASQAWLDKVEQTAEALGMDSSAYIRFCVSERMVEDRKRHGLDKDDDA